MLGEIDSDKVDEIINFYENSAFPAFSAFQNSHYIYLKYFGIKLKSVAYKLIEYKSAY